METMSRRQGGQGTALHADIERISRAKNPDAVWEPLSNRHLARRRLGTAEQPVDAPGATEREDLHGLT